MLIPRTFFNCNFVWGIVAFRIHNIAFVGDIEKAFLQIGLHPSHRDFVRFLWFQEPSNIDFEKFENNELTELRFCRVLFGVTSIPFLLFANSSLPYERKYPILLPTNSHLTILVIQDAHKSVLHNGVREIINEIRCKYWIPRIRQKVKNIINRCVTCKKFEGHPYFYPESPALPECRIVPSHCFSKTGIDYAGPVFIKNGSQLKLNGGMYKVWIVLITCCTSRAIYLDIASSLDGLACIKVLQRFSSRYGQPKLITSDNGSNYISREVQNYASVEGIKWNYNLPKTPWAGGFFERLIKTVKRCLGKLLNVLKVDYEDLLTILVGYTTSY